MTSKNENGSAGGGIFLAVATLAGAGIGVAAGQPTIGILAGLALGALAAILIWLRERRA